MNTFKKHSFICAIFATVFSLLGCLHFLIPAYEQGSTGWPILWILPTVASCVLLLIIFKQSEKKQETLQIAIYSVLALRILFRWITDYLIGNWTEWILIPQYFELICFGIAIWVLSVKPNHTKSIVGLLTVVGSLMVLGNPLVQFDYGRSGARAFAWVFFNARCIIPSDYMNVFRITTAIGTLALYISLMFLAAGRQRPTIQPPQIGAAPVVQTVDRQVAPMEKPTDSGIDAMRGNNVLMFKVEHSAEQPSKTESDPGPYAAEKSPIVTELKFFKELFDMNLITEEEFDAKKNQLLNL